MPVLNFPNAPADVRAAVQVVIDNFDDYSDGATGWINGAKRVLVNYLSAADKDLFRPAIDATKIGIRTAGVDADGKLIGIRMMLCNDAPREAWFQEDVDCSTTVQFYANTAGENFVVYLEGPKTSCTFQLNPDILVRMPWVVFADFFDDGMGGGKAEFDVVGRRMRSTVEESEDQDTLDAAFINEVRSMCREGDKGSEDGGDEHGDEGDDEVEAN
jgi:hypothetical protein